MTIISLAGLHSNTTINSLEALCMADGNTLELMPSRLGNFQIVKINGIAVARAFDNEVDAIAFHLARA